MTSRLCDASLGHVDAQRGEARPGLLETIESESGTAADVEQPEAALIAPGENLMQRRQCLSPGSIRGSMQQHLDLGVIAQRRITRHPAARLEVEVLQIVSRPLAEGLLAQDLPMLAAFTAAMNFGQIREEEARPVDERRQGAVVIGGQRVNSGF